MAVWTVMTRGFRVSACSQLGACFSFRHTGLLLLLEEELVDLGRDFALGHADIVLLAAISGHQVEEAIIRDVDLKGPVSIAKVPLAPL